MLVGEIEMLSVYTHPSLHALSKIAFYFISLAALHPKISTFTFDLQRLGGSGVVLPTFPSFVSLPPLSFGNGVRASMTSTEVPLCITGRAFPPHATAILWSSAVSLRHSSHLWVPLAIVERLKLEQRDDNKAHPTGVQVGNQVRLFVNLSQLKCSHDELREKVTELLATKAITTEAPPEHGSRAPLNTSGEHFPQQFSHDVLASIPSGGDPTLSRYWATTHEAAHIFSNPFRPAFLAEARPVILHACSLHPRLAYYNVCGTEKPDAFNSEICRRYRPVNMCGWYYDPVIAVQLKASAIRYGCINSPVWLSMGQAARISARMRVGAVPVVLGDEKLTSLVNLAMLEYLPHVESHWSYKGVACTRN
ncbi:hypothetical protein TRVL_03104 [Trypanosoma vivax]|nr:hypothetical protein TRVL_03104 [Trypanosoma vivax]